KVKCLQPRKVEILSPELVYEFFIHAQRSTARRQSKPEIRFCTYRLDHKLCGILAQRPIVWCYEDAHGLGQACSVLPISPKGKSSTWRIFNAKEFEVNGFSMKWRPGCKKPALLISSV